MIRQSETAKALAVQRRVIALRREEQIAELRRHEAECALCGDGPTEGQELRMFEPAAGWATPEMICRACHAMRDGENDFTDLPRVWQAIERTNE